MQHLRNVGMSYAEHWLHAMSMSAALFVHAFIPALFETYVSDKINKK